MSIVCGVSETDFAALATDTRVADLWGNISDDATKLDHWRGGWFAGAGVTQSIASILNAVNQGEHSGRFVSLRAGAIEAWRRSAETLSLRHPDQVEALQRTSVELTINVGVDSTTDVRVIGLAPGQVANEHVERAEGELLVLWPRDLNPSEEEALLASYPRPDPSLPIEERIVRTVARLATLILDVSRRSRDVSGIADVGIHGRILPDGQGFQRFRGSACRIASSLTTSELLALTRPND